MAENTEISLADSTFNPRSRTKTWGDPIKWNNRHDAFFAEHGRMRRVFCASLGDVFDKDVDTQWRHDLWNLICATPNLDWLLLTKRIGNAPNLVDSRWMEYGFPDNVWLGATVVNQEEADRDIPKLLQIPAMVRFLSIEPMLGAIDLCNLPSRSGIGRHLDSLSNAGCEEADLSTKINWVICGGESGSNARPIHPDWVRSLRNQCHAADVPFLFKQWGEFGPANDLNSPPLRGDMQIFGDMKKPMCRFGKKTAGRWLDGVQHNAFPKAGL